MKKKQFEKLQESLLKRGYKIYHQHWHREDYMIWKGFHRQDNRWEEDRAAYIIGLSIYDYTDKDYPNLPKGMRDHVGIDVHVDVSRTSSESIDMKIAWHDSTTIEEIEKLAESFYSWVVVMMPQPREE